MTHDRDYYRCLHDADLIEAGLHRGDEIAIALAERLEDMDAESAIHIGDLRESLKDAERDINRMDDRIYELQAEIERMDAESAIHIGDLRESLKDAERDINRMDDRIYELQAEIERITNGDAHVQD